MNDKCPKCGAEMKKTIINILNELAEVEYPFCPKCEYHPSLDKTLNIPLLTAVSGKALRGIDKKDGQFRMKIMFPQEFQKDLMVQTFPKYIVTKPSEWRSSGRRVYKTKQRVAKVYPEFRRNDVVNIIGMIKEGLPLLPIMMHNSSIDITTIFIDEQVKIKKGIFSSFTIKNPVLIAAEEMMENILAHEESSK